MNRNRWLILAGLFLLGGVALIVQAIVSNGPYKQSFQAGSTA
jgi:hypothetical protein